MMSLVMVVFCDRFRQRKYERGSGRLPGNRAYNMFISLFFVVNEIIGLATIGRSKIMMNGEPPGSTSFASFSAEEKQPPTVHPQQELMLQV